MALWTGIKRSFRDLGIRLFRPRSFRHNRKFDPRLSISREEPDAYVIRWGRAPVARAAAPSALTARGYVCNIIGSGPSINDIRDPRLLFRKAAVCVNGSYAAAAAVGARPDYYIVTDKYFIRNKYDLFISAAENSGAVVLGAVAINALCEIDPAVLGRFRIVYYEDLRRPFMGHSLERPGDRAGGRYGESLINHDTYNVAFSTDVSVGIYPVGTVVYTAVQFAYGIGFTELRIFGMDLSDTGRFYHDESPQKNALTGSYESEIRPAFELVKRYAAEQGLSIINCSPHSRLPGSIMPKADSNEILTRGR